MSPSAWRRGMWAVGAALVLGLGGCASVPEGARAPHDPWEGFNRSVYSFNDAVDGALIKPAAQVYQALLPQPVRSGIGNVLGNLGDAWTSVNLLLQAKPRQALETGMRVVVNTGFGLGGLLDVADEMGLERGPSEDFGQTLGFWGLKSGPYLVLPLLGPSTLRDAGALLLDMPDSGPSLVWKEPRDRNPATVLQLLEARVRLLNAGRVLDEIALDKYVLMRDAYMARRRSLLYDGEPPDDEPAPPPFKRLLKPAGEPPAAPVR